MREIKFRGQRVDNKEWITGDLCKSISGAPCIMPSAFFATREFDDQEEDQPQVISDSLAIGGFYPVVPETVGQYTGLKDKNEVEIYEGDILGLPEHKHEVWSSSVYYKEGGFYITLNGAESILNSYRTGRSIVIGNIHSNPELLK